MRERREWIKFIWKEIALLTPGISRFFGKKNYFREKKLNLPIFGSKTPFFGSKTPFFGTKTPIFEHITIFPGFLTLETYNLQPNLFTHCTGSCPKSPSWDNKLLLLLLTKPWFPSPSWCFFGNLLKLAVFPTGIFMSHLYTFLSSLVLVILYSPSLKFLVQSKVLLMFLEIDCLSCKITVFFSGALIRLRLSCWEKQNLFLVVASPGGEKIVIFCWKLSFKS